MTTPIESKISSSRLMEKHPVIIAPVLYRANPAGQGYLLPLHFEINRVEVKSVLKNLSKINWRPLSQKNYKIKSV